MAEVKLPQHWIIAELIQPSHDLIIGQIYNRQINASRKRNQTFDLTFFEAEQTHILHPFYILAIGVVKLSYENTFNLEIDLFFEGFMHFFSVFFGE